MPAPYAAIVLAIALASSASAQPDRRPLPTGGDIFLPRGDGDLDRLSFRTRPDTTVRIVFADSALTLPIELLLDVAGAYEGTIGEARIVQRGGYEVDDGRLTLYFSQQLSLRAVLALLALGVALVGAFVVWALARIRRDARRKAELARYRSTLAASREDERLRLARELHDGPLQEFHAVRLALEAEGVDGEVGADLLEAVRDVRRVVEDLRPPALDAYGLGAALESLAVRFRRRHPGLYVEADVDGDGSALPAEVQLTVYRVCQESLTNVSKHAGASAVTVRYREAGAAFRLTVEDDGSGFDPSAPPVDGGGHFGLSGIRERAEAIGAEVRIVTAPGEGTRLTLACGDLGGTD